MTCIARTVVGLAIKTILVLLFTLHHSCSFVVRNSIFHLRNGLFDLSK